MKNNYPLARSIVPAAQRGLTLVELLVAMTLMGLVTLATISLYTVASQTSKTVDTSQELNDNARFAFDVIGQALRLAGYQNYLPNNPDIPKLAGAVYPAICTNATLPCPVMGFNNSKILSTGNVSDFGTTNSGGTSNNYSDTLGVTFFGESLPLNPAAPDGSMVDCQGAAQAAPTMTAPLSLSLFHVTTGATGEPELYCIGTSRTSQPIVRGVESFQVMYGIDTSVAGMGAGSSVPNRWVSGQDVTDWMRVRAIRIGLVLRGGIGSSQSASQQANGNDLYPLGEDFSAGNSEAGLKYVPPNDGRLRKAFTATFMLRNSL